MEPNLRDSQALTRAHTLGTLRAKAGLSEEDYPIREDMLNWEWSGGTFMAHKRNHYPYISVWNSGKILVTLARETLTQEFGSVEEAAYLEAGLRVEVAPLPAPG